MARNNYGDSDDKEYSHRYDVHYHVTNYHWGTIQRMISKVKNYYHDSESDVHVRAHEEGLTSLCHKIDDIQKENGVDDPELQELIDAKAELDKIIEEDNLRDFYRNMYKRRGPEYLMDYCTKHGIDPEPHLREFRLGAKEQSWVEKAEVWLNKTLALYPKGCEVSFIRERAINEGLLPNPAVDPEKYERRWRQLKTVASVMGISSHATHGIWKLSMAEQS